MDLLEERKRSMIESFASCERRMTSVRNLLRLKKEKNMRNSEKREENFILDSDPNDSPIYLSKRSSGGNLLRLKKEENMRNREEREECFILDSDPNDSPIDLSKLCISSDLNATDVSILAEKGQVACRDYPHSRHLCFKNPFGKTPHKSYCELCYCFVCDKVAPCKNWTGVAGHCHAIDDEYWSYLRENKT